MVASIAPEDPPGNAAPEAPTLSAKKISPISSTTPSKLERKHRRRKRCPSWCDDLWIFMIVTCFLVPIIVFATAALFAFPLWGIECSVSGDTDPDMCKYYEWILYILGNLVGLATPLTNNTPSSGHIIAELLDILVSTWSLAVAGTVIGIVGALTFTTLAVSGLESFMLRRVVRRQLQESAEDGELDLPKMKQLLAEGGFEISSQRAEEIFEAADKNGSGTVDKAEVQKIMAILQTTHAPQAHNVSRRDLHHLHPLDSSPGRHDQQYIASDHVKMMQEQKELLDALQMQVTFLNEQIGELRSAQFAQPPAT